MLPMALRLEKALNFFDGMSLLSLTLHLRHSDSDKGIHGGKLYDADLV